ncbi:MAG: hypothetical protein U9R25_16235 [Chloroflexota bacterium]|nr:hypothetical protein [Chloroflexota bacterium]
MSVILLLVGVWFLVFLLAYWLHRQGRPDWYKDVLAAGLLGLAAIGYFWRILIGDAYMPADGGDLISFLWPTYRFAADSLRSGTWPLWNPYLYGGAPHVADIQAGFLYPVNLALFLLVPGFGVRAMEGLGILHLWWAGLGMYVFLRSLPWEEKTSWRVGRTAALAGGLAFAFCDALWIHFGNLNYIAVVSWLPWVMTCFGRALEHGSGENDGRWRDLGWAALGGLFLGIATLAGHIQATIFIAVAVVLYGLFWLYWEFTDQKRDCTGFWDTLRPALGRLIATVAILAVVAFLIAAPILLPALQLAPYSGRADWTYQEAVGYSLAPPQWIGLLIPGFFGRGPQLHWGPWPRVEAGYLGVLPLILAVLALLARQGRRTWILAGISGVAFLLALGIYSVPHGWLSALPGFNLLRAPGRFMILVDFGLAALAGVGFQALIRASAASNDWRALIQLEGGLRWGARVLIAIIVPLTLAVLLLTQDRDPEIYIRMAVTAIALLLFVGFFLASTALIAARRAGWARPGTIAVLALILIFLDLASTGAYFDIGTKNPATGFDHPEIAAFLSQEEDPFRIDARTGIDQLWQPNTAFFAEVDDVWGLVNPSVLAYYERYWEEMGSRSSQLYDFLNARYVIARKDVELDWDKFELAFDGDPDLNLYFNQRALPRAQLVYQAQVIDSSQDAELVWSAVHAPAFDPSQEVVLERGETKLLPELGEAAGEGSVTWLRREPNDLLMEVTTGGPGYLTLSDVWYPGWQAEIIADGVAQRQPVLRANTAFRAIPLWQEGTYQVRLRFQPPGWKVGWLLFALALILLVFIALLVWWERRQTP